MAPRRHPHPPRDTGDVPSSSTHVASSPIEAVIRSTSRVEIFLTRCRRLRRRPALRTHQTTQHLWYLPSDRASNSVDLVGSTQTGLKNWKLSMGGIRSFLNCVSYISYNKYTKNICWEFSGCSRPVLYRGGRRSSPPISRTLRLQSSCWRVRQPGHDGLHHGG